MNAYYIMLITGPSLIGICGRGSALWAGRDEKKTIGEGCGGAAGARSVDLSS